MSSSPFTPSTATELQECVRSAQQVVACGGGSKAPLGPASAPGATPVSTLGLSGVVEYDPAEFTVTARAGTRCDELAAILLAERQHLPFDPPLVEAGATLGGTLAAGLNGPGAYRFGGVRDFVLGVRFVDGRGQLLRAGGKVVKNAAGFDVPKFLVGSAGRFAIVEELTFKVFPAPESRLTLRVAAPTPEAAAAVLAGFASRASAAEALRYEPAEASVFVRLAGTGAGTAAQANQFGRGAERLDPGAADAHWHRAREFTWAPGGPGILKTPITPGRIPAIEKALPEAAARTYDLGGQVAYIKDSDGVRAALDQLGLDSTLVCGSGAASPSRSASETVLQRIKEAFDPDSKFPDVL